MRTLVALLLAATTLPFASARAQQASQDAPCLTTEGTRIPVIERPGEGAGPLVVLLTGDGGWANADEQVARGLVARGASVIGVNMRGYLDHKRTPDEAARDVGCVAQRYLTAWRRVRVLLLGYSRGADIAPFVAARWPEALRRRVTMVALVSMSSHANFQFHLIDLVRDVRRPDDIEIAPEISQLRGLRVICVYGDTDRDSGCPLTDTSIVQQHMRTGGHRLTGGFDAIVELLEAALANNEGPVR